MKSLTEDNKAQIAQKLREIADILNPPVVSRSGGGNGNGPPTGP